MGESYLIDSNVILEFTGNVLPAKARNFMIEIIDGGRFNISVINYIEVLGHSSSNEELEHFVNEARLLTLTDDIVKATIALRKFKKIKLPDAIITATAMVNDITLLSRNKRDFANIDGLSSLIPITCNRIR